MSVANSIQKNRTRQAIKSNVQRQDWSFLFNFKSVWIQPMIGSVVLIIWTMLTYFSAITFLKEVTLCSVIILGLLILKAIHKQNDPENRGVTH